MKTQSRWVGMTLAYVTLMVVMSLFLGTVRTVILVLVFNTPMSYVVLSVAVNAGIALIPGLAAFPILLALYAWLPRLQVVDPCRVGVWGSIVGVYPGFVYLMTSIGFYGPVFGDLEALMTQVAFWVGQGVVIAVAWRMLFIGKPVGSVLKRAAAVATLLLSITAVLGVIAATTDPSASSPLDLDRSAAYAPHVFLVLVDTLRADHLGTYGYPLPTSPNIDAFAEEATVYDMAIAQAPWTRPSCAALLTSLYPPDMGMRDSSGGLAPQFPILPQYLKVEDYATAGVVSSVQVSRVFGFDKGFDLLDIGRAKLRWAGLQIPLVRLGLHKGGYPRYNAEELTDETIAWIDSQRSGGKPLFMYLHYSDPHSPYKPPADRDRWREFAGEAGRSIDVPPTGPPDGDETLSEAEMDALVARYDAEIAYFDEQFGRWVRHLEDTGLYADSLIVLTADHGEEFLDHDGWGHSHSLYNELLRVPLIVKYPERLAAENGRRVERPVALVDVAATVKDVLQARWETPGWRGRSLLAGPGERTIYAEMVKPAMRTIYSRSGKLIQALDASDEISGEWYYSLTEDFDELGDGAVPDTISTTKLDAMRAIAADIHSGSVTSLEVELDAETLGELRALGYID